MDAECSALDATEVHFVIDSISAVCVQNSSEDNRQVSVLNQQAQKVLLNGVTIEDASLDGLVPKELLQRLVDAANIALERMSLGFSASMKSLQEYARRSAAAAEYLDSIDLQQRPRTTLRSGDNNGPQIALSGESTVSTSSNEAIGTLNRVEGRQTPKDDHAPNASTEGKSSGEEPAASEPSRRRPAQEKLEKEIADYNTEIEARTEMSGGKHITRVEELKKLRAACEYKLKRLRIVLKSTKKWRESIKMKNPPLRREGRPSLEEAEASLKPGKHHICGQCGRQFDIGIKLRMHERRRHGRNYDRSFSCDARNEAYTKMSRLTRQKLTHNGAKPFECDVCHKSFARKDNLRVHELVHSDRPYECAECGYRYATMVALEKHRRIHLAA